VHRYQILQSVSKVLVAANSDHLLDMIRYVTCESSRALTFCNASWANVMNCCNMMILPTNDDSAVGDTLTTATAMMVNNVKETLMIKIMLMISNDVLPHV